MRTDATRRGGMHRSPTTYSKECYSIAVGIRRCASCPIPGRNARCRSARAFPVCRPSSTPEEIHFGLQHRVIEVQNLVACGRRMLNPPIEARYRRRTTWSRPLHAQRARTSGGRSIAAERPPVGDSFHAHRTARRAFQFRRSTRPRSSVRCRDLDRIVHDRPRPSVRERRIPTDALRRPRYRHCAPIA